MAGVGPPVEGTLSCREACDGFRAMCLRGWSLVGHTAAWLVTGHRRSRGGGKVLLKSCWGVPDATVLRPLPVSCAVLPSDLLSCFRFVSRVEKNPAPGRERGTVDGVCWGPGPCPAHVNAATGHPPPTAATPAAVCCDCRFLLLHGPALSCQPLKLSPWLCPAFRSLLFQHAKLYF